MAKIKQLTDKHGEVVYPVSKEAAIYDDNGVLLSNKISTFITRLVDNLANYYLKSEIYTKEEIDTLIEAIQGFSYIVVSELPTASAFTMGTIYLVPSADPQTQNTKDEYITIRSGSIGSYTYSWEQIGSTAIDLSGYVTTEALNTALADYTTTANLTTLLAAKQDTIADLTSIRSGASLGATAYQKPSSGIPASDIAAGVIPDISGKQDVIPDLSTIRSGAAAGATAVQPAELEDKQDTLVSGENIKTINNQSIVGSGNIQIQTEGGDIDAVKFTQQTLTDAQKTQARTNIGAVAASALSALETAIAAKYSKPSGGIPETDLASGVQSALALARTSIQSLTDYYSKTEVDALLAAVSSEQYVDVTTLPTASASTLGKIYLVGPDANDFYDRYYTSYDGSTYSWVPAGNTEINLANYATKAEVSQLQQEVDDLDTAIDLREETRTETKTLVLGTDFTESVGYAPASTGAIVDWNTNFHHSSDIPLPAGGILQVRASGPNTIAIIAKKVTGTSNYEPVAIGAHNSEMRDYSYTATEDCEVVVSWQVNNNMYLGDVTKTATETLLISAISELQEDMSALQDSQAGLEETVGEISGEFREVISDDLTAGYVAGKYINHLGALANNSSFGYKEFSVKAGAQIRFYAEFANPSTAALAKKLTPPQSETVLYEELFAGANYTSQTIEYTAPEDMTIAVSFYTANKPNLEEQYGRNITINTDTIESMQTTIGVLQEFQNKSIIQDIDFGYMFNRIAVIGDSLASGRVEGIVGQSDAQGADFYGFSWLAFLAKRWRCDRYVNYSRGGQHTSDWITEWLPIMQADPTVYDAYFIALGTNNEYNESDPSGDQANYDAFIERYNSIIDDVRTKAPNAVIFLVSLYEKRAGNTTLEEIAEERMATDKGIYYIDYANTAQYLRYSSEVNWRGHFSSTGYAYVASVINQIVNRIVWENQTEEFWQQFAKYHNIRNDFGTTANRPSASAVGVGFTYYDTTLGKMVMSNGTAWVNMDGTALA